MGRASLFIYLTTDLSAEYQAIMDLLTGPLLADFSAAVAALRLVERRPRAVSARRARTHHLRDFLCSRNRYQASKLGGRVHRDAEAMLAVGDGA
ncbi:hypothetical protein [Amycolatopsis thailandensis]|uniref:hypothetical protein n=1 Tax=Amycolatopsis thailandensis TaxID=589330 RepID=UPI00362D9B08